MLWIYIYYYTIKGNFILLFWVLFIVEYIHKNNKRTILVFKTLQQSAFFNFYESLIMIIIVIYVQCESDTIGFQSLLPSDTQSVSEFIINPLGEHASCQGLSAYIWRRKIYSRTASKFNLHYNPKHDMPLKQPNWWHTWK